MRFRARGQQLVLGGLALTILGVLFLYMQEAVSFDSTDNISYKVLEALSLSLIIGILLSLVGFVALALQFGARQCGQAGVAALAIFGISWGAFAIGVLPINIHGWSGSLLVVFSFLFVVGVLFLIIGAVKFLRSEQEGE